MSPLDDGPGVRKGLRRFSTMIKAGVLYLLLKSDDSEAEIKNRKTDEGMRYETIESEPL